MTKKLPDKTVCHLQNPWSDTIQTMTWGEIKAWCKHSVHPDNQVEWLCYARQAVTSGDAETLGKMIIGI